jgi:hypothetical protein
MNRRAVISPYLLVLLAVAGTAASLSSAAFVSYRRDGLRREARIQAHELAAAAAALAPGERLELGAWLLRREQGASSAQGPLVGCRLEWEQGRITRIRYQTNDQAGDR